MDDLYAGGDDGRSPESDGKEDGGYCIKIYVGADNQVKSVAVKQEHEMPMQDEQGGQAGAAGEEEGAEMEMMTRVPVDSIEGALALVQQAYQAQGQLPTGGAEGMPQGDAMADMMQGYGKGGLRGQNEGMGIRKVFR